MLNVSVVYAMMIAEKENLTMLIYPDDCATEDCSCFSLSNRA
jgi:hypothetical protein